MRYLVIVERAENNFAAYSPDLSGCVATGETREEMEQNMREAIEFHLEGMRLHGDPIPEPSTLSLYVNVAT
ncbi:MAG TPA: type II toxin-antitoxin system HicB family antitoxin [Thermoanaerobaculia bacterium]|jgi:predicted RNase H-like HicB family nuclease|nr:type II toxin-antitoxin system HicB family antitoxin [Thermoanaerobaculia bacterium]